MSSRNSYTHPRDEILRTMERIYRYRMTTTSGGNLSMREECGDIWITPARVDKGGLRREDIVRVRGEGGSEGAHPPSSELPLHEAIYRARPDIGGVVHAHPVALVAFSVIHQAPDTHLFHQARHVCGEAGFAPYALPGSEELGDSVAEVFARGAGCVVMENHGVITGGSSLEEAFQRFETLEFTAKTVIKARLLGDVRYLNEEEIRLPERRALRMPEFAARTCGSEEKELRHQLAEFVKRAYQQRLFISTQGTFSARLNDSSFLITPYRCDRATIGAEDIVLVRGGEIEAGKTPSRATEVHLAIYRRHPEIGAIVNAYPVNATAFSVTGAALNSRTIPESYLVLREVRRIPYGVQFLDSEEVARQVSPSQPAALLENDGVLVAGSNILDAFDRLEVLESTAEALINSRPLGTVAAMPEDVVQALDAAFVRSEGM